MPSAEQVQTLVEKRAAAIKGASENRDVDDLMSWHSESATYVSPGITPIYISSPPLLTINSKQHNHLRKRSYPRILRSSLRCNAYILREISETYRTDSRIHGGGNGM